MKKYSFLVIILVMLFTLAGCSADSQSESAQDSTTEAVKENAADSGNVTDADTGKETSDAALSDAAPEHIRVRAIAPEGATTIAMLKMIHDQDILLDRAEVTYESLNTTDLLVAEIMGEKTDFAIAPTNLAAKLYNKGVPYKLVSVNTHGNLYMITTDDISGWEALKGREVYMIGQGLVPDLIFRYLAEANGLTPDVDFNITYLAGTSEVAPTFLSGKAEIIIMPEPVLSVVGTKDIPFKILFDFQEEYEKTTGMTGGFPQAGLLVSNELIETEPEVVEAFIAGLKESCDWVNENAETAAQYITELDLGIPEPVAVKAIPGLNIRHVSVADEKESLETLFGILYEFSPDAIGGEMPDEAFYYEGQ